MFTQLSLFDSPSNLDSTLPLVSFGSPEIVVVKQPVAVAIEPVRIYGDNRSEDSLQPMGDLARLVLARYQMVALRREEMMRRKAEQPRKSIRVLSPA